MSIHLFPPRQLDAEAFARDAAVLAGELPLHDCQRLASELHGPPGDALVRWQAAGEHRSAADGILRPALRLQARADVVLACQRCLEALPVSLEVDRHFVFVPDEAMAEALDDESEDDVLALVPAPDLLQLLEDELLMALPLVPRHDVCPVAVRMSAADAGFEAAMQERAHPFAGLAGLKTDKPA